MAFESYIENDGLSVAERNGFARVNTNGKGSFRMLAGLYTRKSPIHGYGLYTNVDIKKGQRVFILKGEVIDRGPLDYKLFPNAVGVGKSIWINPSRYSVVNYINHSCNPNIGMRGRVTFVALRDIKKGEELTFDYSISEDSDWRMQCNCPAENCRGTILGIQHLPETIFRSYLPYIPHYFQKAYWGYNEKRG